MSKKLSLQVSIVKDWEIQNYDTCKPFKNNNMHGSELITNKDIDSIIQKTIKPKSLRNRGITGNELKKELANTSITRPKIWESRGLNEK